MKNTKVMGKHTKKVKLLKLYERKILKLFKKQKLCKKILKLWKKTKTVWTNIKLKLLKMLKLCEK